MSSFLDRAQEFVRNVVRVFLVERDAERVLAYFSPDITWFGTGEHEVGNGYAAAAEFVRQDIASHPEPFVLTDEWYCPAALAPRLCGVMMGVQISSPGSDGLIFLLNVRGSWIVRQEPDDTFRILHRHMSVPNGDQLSNEFFPHAMGRQNFLLLQEHLRVKTAEIENFYNLLNGGVCKIALDPACTLLYANDYFFEMFGYCRADLVAHANATIQCIYEEDLPWVLEETQAVLQSSKRFSIQYRIKHKNGSLVWVRLNARLAEERYQDDIPVLHCIYIDITKFIRSYEQLALEKERYRIITELTDGITFEYDFAADALTLSNCYEQYFDFPPLIHEFKCYITKDFFANRTEYRRFLRLYHDVVRRRPNHGTELRLKIRDGSWNWFALLLHPLYNERGRVIKLIGKLRNIHQQKCEQQELEHKSQMDPLTKLYNKISVEQAISAYLASLPADTMAALFVLDIDNFKIVNDTMGHFVGDHVLTLIAGQLSAIFRTSDIVGRFGGDEFIILMKDFQAREVAIDKAVRLINAVARGSQQSISGYQVSVSIGIAFLDGRRPLTYQQWFQYADKALYAAKNRGRNCYEVYHLALEERRGDENHQEHAAVTVPEVDLRCQNALWLLDTILDFLLHTAEAREALLRSLKFIGDSLRLCQVYAGIYTDDVIEVIAQWSGEDIAPLPTCIPLRKELHLARFGSDGIFHSNDPAHLDPPIRAICEMLHTTALLQCLMCKNNQAIGVIGVHYCGAVRVWTQDEIHILQTITRVLTDTVLKVRDCECGAAGNVC